MVTFKGIELQHTSCRVLSTTALGLCMALLAVACLPAAANPSASQGALLSATSAPFPAVLRTIVPNLTPWLQATLAKNKVTQLVVVPHARGAAMKIDWQAVNGTLQGVSHVHTAQELLQKLHTQHRLHRVGLASSTTGAPAAVALLVQGNQGSISMQQLNLVATANRYFRRVRLLTLQYNSYPDKGDTILLFNKAGMPMEVATASTSVFRDVFTRIYDTKTWGAKGGGSGDGSTIERTEKIRGYVLDVVTRYNITSVLDSSCGSMLWMPLFLQKAEAFNPSFKFMGTDVVCTLIDQHKKTFMNHTNWNFECVDYANQQLPSGYDLIFSRDSLQHVPLHAVWQFLNNVRASGARYLLVGSYPHAVDGNKEVNPGDCYNVDLLKPPFSARTPVEEFEEGDHEGKHMLLFDMARMTWQDTLEGLF